jgi:hypothetical protein
MLTRTVIATFILAIGLACPSWAEWDVNAFTDEDTLEFFTVDAQGEEHWATVWFVELDGDVYIRLGGRAEKRITENVNTPQVKIRVGGETFDEVLVEETPDREQDVAVGMGDKYLTAYFMKWMPDRYTAKLTAP